MNHSKEFLLSFVILMESNYQDILLLAMNHLTHHLRTSSKHSKLIIVMLLFIKLKSLFNLIKLLLQQIIPFRMDILKVNLTYIKSWDLIGVDDNGNERIIDKHTDFQLCPSSDGHCDQAITKTFRIANPKPFKKYILRQYENSYPGYTYLLVRYIDFFGILCSENSSKACYFPHIKRTCQINHRLRIDFSFSFLFLSIL